MRLSLRFLLPTLSLMAGLLLPLSQGCMPAESPSSARAPRAQKWLDRAQASMRTADLEDAQDAITQAMRFAPQDPEIRLVAANLALAKLDFKEALRLTEGDQRTEALGVRGRAYWYQGNVQAAGATLEVQLRDPEVRDPWAKAISKLANRGTGRQPYRSEGSIVAAIEMPQVRGPALIVPIEVDGEQGLGVVATGTAEVVLDSAQRREPSWASIRLAERIEFHDVPAVTQDLSGISRMMGAPIKALLGVNFLRHANCTFDFQAHQFVVRRFEPPRPPEATDVPLYYIRGGGMLMRSTLRPDTAASAASLLIDSGSLFPLSLDAEGWRKAGVEPSTLKPLPDEPSIKQGVVPMLRVGSLDIPQVTGVMTSELANIEHSLGLNLDGIVGAGVLARFRMTLGDGGKVLWVEEDLQSFEEQGPRAAPPQASPETAPPADSAPTAPTTSAPASPSPRKAPAAPAPKPATGGKR